MTMKTKYRIVVLSLNALGLCATAHGAVLFSDNFNAADDTLNDADLTGRRGGTLASSIKLSSAKVQQNIAGNQLSMVDAASGNGRVRFNNDGSSGWFDWSAGSAGTDIITAGGFRVEFDFTPVNTTASTWVAFAAGFYNGAPVGEPGARLTDGDTDSAMLHRCNGGTQIFDSGSSTSGGSVTATAGPRKVVLTYGFTSWADGSTVDFLATVDGITVADTSFQWNNNDAGEVNFELETNQTGMLIDNLVVSTVPEPSSAALLGLAGLAMTLRRRR
ncbi:MAG: PEP-CTERM sorting domain-containing protein [Akkermansiaceae bacterium]|nr:PEP-CTERM sorting domain-containing protein [Akkermansiaceae bacterium]